MSGTVYTRDNHHEQIVKYSYHRLSSWNIQQNYKHGSKFLSKFTRQPFQSSCTDGCQINSKNAQHRYLSFPIATRLESSTHGLHGLHGVSLTASPHLHRRTAVAAALSPNAPAAVPGRRRCRRRFRWFLGCAIWSPGSRRPARHP